MANTLQNTMQVSALARLLRAAGTRCWMLLLVGLVGLLTAPLSAQSTNSLTPPFRQCPSVGLSPTCGVLIVVNANNGVNYLSDPNVKPYDGGDDTMIGVQNNSSQPLQSLPLLGNTTIFGFDGDGICDVGVSPQPSGCPFGPTHYEGPGVSFKGISADFTSGTVVFNPPIPPGGSAYFALDEALTSTNYTTGIIASPSTLTFVSINGSQPASQQVTLQGVGGNYTYSAAVSVTTPAGIKWLSVTAGSPPGTNLSNRTTPDVLNVSVSNFSGLPLGVYKGQIVLTSSTAGNSPITIPVQLAITTPLAVSAPCPITVTAGGGFSIPFNVTGGVGPYQIVSGNFPAGVSASGTTLTGSVSSYGNYAFTVVVADSAGQSVTYTCNIVVQPPAVAIAGGCPLPPAQIGVPYGPINVIGAGGVGNYSFSGTGFPAGLTLQSNGVLSGIVGASVTPGSYPVSISVASGGQTATQYCSLAVQLPALRITGGCPAGTLHPGDPVNVPLSATGGTGTYAFSVSQGSLPPGLSVNGSAISGTISATATPQTYQFTIQATSGDQTATVNCAITVAPAALTLTSACPAGGAVNSPYGPFALSASGATGTYAFGIVNGSLPPGVALNGNVISGTPTTAGTYNFAVQVSSGGQTVTGSSCSVVIAAPAISISGSCASSSVAAGSPVSLGVSVNGGTGPYTYSISGASFLSISGTGATATITGTPTTPGTYPFTVTVVDNGGNRATFTCSLTVVVPPLAIGAACPGPVTVNNAFSLPLAASGGQGAYTFSYSGPSFLALSSSTGSNVTLNGTPTSVGSFPFTITLNDANGTPAATFQCTLVVNATPLQLTGGAGCPAASVTIPNSFSLPLSVTGGAAPYTFAVSGSASFLTLSSTTGTSTTLSGTPSTPGTYNFTITVTDSASSTPATLSCALTVNPATIPAITVANPTSPQTVLDPVNLVLRLASPTPVPLQGTVTLTFASTANGSTNPQVTFTGANATQPNTFTFTIPAGSSSVQLPSIQQGTVAGTITLTLSSLTDNNRNVLPSPAPSITITVARQAPVLTNISLNERSDGFDIVLTGYSTTQELTTASVTLTPRTGSSLDGTNTFSVNLQGAASSFYGSTAAAKTGGSFKLTIPVNISGDTKVIGSVSATVSNSIGASNTLTANR